MIVCVERKKVPNMSRAERLNIRTQSVADCSMDLLSGQKPDFPYQLNSGDSLTKRRLARVFPWYFDVHCKEFGLFALLSYF